MTTIQDLASELASIFTQIKALQMDASELVAAAAEQGISPKAIRKAAKEINMDTDKRAKLYEDERQLDMFRREIGLKPSFARAAE